MPHARFRMAFCALGSVGMVIAADDSGTGVVQQDGYVEWWCRTAFRGTNTGRQNGPALCGVGDIGVVALIGFANCLDTKIIKDTLPVRRHKSLLCDRKFICCYLNNLK